MEYITILKIFLVLYLLVCITPISAFEIETTNNNSYQAIHPSNHDSQNNILEDKTDNNFISSPQSTFKGNDESFTPIMVLDDVDITEETAQSHSNTYLTYILLILLATVIIASIYYATKTIIHETRAEEITLAKYRSIAAEDLYMEAQYGYVPERPYHNVNQLDYFDYNRLRPLHGDLLPDENRINELILWHCRYTDNNYFYVGEDYSQLGDIFHLGRVQGETRWGNLCEWMPPVYEGLQSAAAEYEEKYYVLVNTYGEVEDLMTWSGEARGKYNLFSYLITPLSIMNLVVNITEMIISTPHKSHRIKNTGSCIEKK